MSSYWLLVSSVYKDKIKSKPIIAITLIFMILLSIAIYWTDIQENFLSGEQVKIALIDNSREDAINYISSNDVVVFENTNKSLDEIDEDVKTGKYEAALVLSLNEEGAFEPELRTNTPLKLQTQDSIQSALNIANQLFLVNSFKLTDDQMSKLMNAQVTLKEFKLSKNLSAKSIDEKRNGTFVAYAFGIMVYIFVALYLSMITTEIAIEKGSRIMEILMSSVSPATHLFSKVTGFFFVAITQFTFLITYGLLLSYFSAGNKFFNMVQDTIQGLGNMFFFYSFSYLLLSSLLYLFIGALMGSMVSKAEESSQAVLPATITITIGFYVMITGLYNPDSILIKIFSFIPLTSGLVMPLRIGATSISNIEILISILLLIITIVIVIVTSLVLYRGSVLSYKNGSIFQKAKSSWTLSK